MSATQIYVESSQKRTHKLHDWHQIAACSAQHQTTICLYWTLRRLACSSRAKPTSNGQWQKVKINQQCAQLGKVNGYRLIK